MNAIARIMTTICWMICLMVSMKVQAQWTTIRAHVQGSDIRKALGISYDNYKGMESGIFEIVASVTEVRDKGKVSFQLRTQSISLVQYDTYVYRPYLSVKSCPGSDGILREIPYTNVFRASDLGTDVFNAALHTASATFDMEITFIVKDEKYGISGFGSQKGWGYRVNRVFKNVKANGVFWAEEPIETSLPIEDIKLLNNPKLLSFSSHDAAIQSEAERFIAEKNQEVETRCIEKANTKAADQKQREEENKKAEANAIEIEEMKKKLGGSINMTANTIKSNDFWSGETDKNTVSTKDNDDFWSGEKNERSDDDDFWSGGRDKTESNDGKNDLEVVSKDGRIYLKDAYDIIKEWDVNTYSGIAKIDGSNEFFKLYVRTGGTGFLGQNNIVIIDRQGKVVKIDGEEIFGSIKTREGGGYTIMKYLSDSYYQGKEERYPRVQDWYTSSSEAISDVEKGIERIRKEIAEERRGNRPNTVYLVATYTFNVVEVKEISTNAKMQAIRTKTGYKVR